MHGEKEGAMLTTVAASRVFDFSHAVGRGAISGEGFASVWL